MKTVLVAEDDMISRMIVVKIIRTMGYEVLESENGRIAHDLLMIRTNIDLLVTDIVIPEMDGRTLVKMLRAEPSPTRGSPSFSYPASWRRTSFPMTWIADPRSICRNPWIVRSWRNT